MGAMIKKIGTTKIIVALVAIVLIVVACILIFGNKDIEDTGETAPVKVVELFLDAKYIDRDSDALIKLYHDQYVSDLSDKYGGKDEYVKACDENIKSTIDNLEKQYGTLSIHWNIRGVEECDKGQKDLLISKYSKGYNLNVEDIKRVQVEMYYTDSATYTLMSFPIISIDGTWYLAQ